MKASTFKCWQLNQHTVHATAHPSVGEHSPVLAFMLSSLPNGGTGKWETGKHAHFGEKSLFLKLNIAHVDMDIFCCLKEILKRPLAFEEGVGEGV